MRPPCRLPRRHIRREETRVSVRACPILFEDWPFGQRFAMDSIEFAGRQGRQPNRRYRTGMRSRSRRSLDAVKKITMSDIRYTAFPSDLGWMALAWQSPLLLELTFGHSTSEQATTALRAAAPGNAAASGNRPAGHGRPSEPMPPKAIDRLIRSWIERIQAYANGDPHDDLLDIPVDLTHMTDFQRAVVHHCRRIPRGEAVTYGGSGPTSRLSGSRTGRRASHGDQQDPADRPVPSRGGGRWTNGRLFGAPGAGHEETAARPRGRHSLRCRQALPRRTRRTKLVSSRNDRPRYRLVRCQTLDLGFDGSSSPR